MIFRLKHTETAFCFSCDKWKEVGVFSLDARMEPIQLCPECLAEFVIQIDPRISFKLSVKRSPIHFDWLNMRWIGLEIPEIKELEKVYPDVDVVAEFKSMRTWLEKNKDNKKAHKTQWRSFINKWLASAQRKEVIGC